MQIAVFGSGYVGLVSALCLAEIGHQVISVDSDAGKIAALERGESPIYEAQVPELLQRHRGRRLRFSANPASAVAASDVLFLAVGTPQGANGDADLTQVREVARQIAPAIHRSTLIVEKSTVPVCTCDSLRALLLASGARAGWFSVASNPEFLREGTAVADFLYPDRIVAGADDSFSAGLLQDLYRPLTSGAYYRCEDAVPGVARPGRPRMILTSAKSAELIKHASNAYLASRISYINMVARLAEAVDANIDEVRAGMGADPRIGSEFLAAGIGYGGSCLPKDVAAFAAVARSHGIPFPLLDQVTRVNQEQRLHFVRNVARVLGPLEGRRLGVLGLAFKEGTDDVRESPAIAVVGDLLGRGATIRAYDPAAMARCRQVLPSRQVTYLENAYRAATGCDALLILTAWREFHRLDLHTLHSVMKQPLIFDGRNLFDPAQMAAAGFLYHSVGRPTVAPKARLVALPPDRSLPPRRLESKTLSHEYSPGTAQRAAYR